MNQTSAGTERTVNQIELEQAYADGMTARLHADPEYRRPSDFDPQLLRQAWVNGWNYGDAA